ncbi:hypothetical protein DKC15_012665 [Acinetobacter pittii]|nr:hypothetical protein DKC15_012665 [Acinetobacter pittii]
MPKRQFFKEDVLFSMSFQPQIRCFAFHPEKRCYFEPKLPLDLNKHVYLEKVCTKVGGCFALVMP